MKKALLMITTLLISAPAFAGFCCNSFPDGHVGCVSKVGCDATATECDKGCKTSSATPTPIPTPKSTPSTSGTSGTGSTGHR